MGRESENANREYEEEKRQRETAVATEMAAVETVELLRKIVDQLDGVKNLLRYLPHPQCNAKGEIKVEVMNALPDCYQGVRQESVPQHADTVNARVERGAEAARRESWQREQAQKQVDDMKAGITLTLSQSVAERMHEHPKLKADVERLRWWLFAIQASIKANCTLAEVMEAIGKALGGQSHFAQPEYSTQEKGVER